MTVTIVELTVEMGDRLQRYGFHTHTAQHYFCDRCGIYTHRRRRSDPNEYGANLASVGGVDIRAVEWRRVDGRNHPSDR